VGSGIGIQPWLCALRESGLEAEAD
jgi:hypothetical protein